MDMVIHSSLTSKITLNPTPICFPSARINAARFSSFISIGKNFKLRQLNSPSSRFFKQDPPFLPLRFFFRGSTNASSSRALPSPLESNPTTPCHELGRKQTGRLALGAAEALLRCKVPAGAVFLLSALIVFLIQPTLAPPAFTMTQTATKTLVRTELLSSAWTGFFAGCSHTIRAALAPLSIGQIRMESAVVGALWGCGHDTGQVILGLLFLLLKDRLHIEIMCTWGTRAVGLTLLVIGSMGIKEVSEVPTPCIAMENGECQAGIIESVGTTVSGGKKVGFATFASGIVHRLQPDALMMVLPALALLSRLAGAAFLAWLVLHF